MVQAWLLTHWLGQGRSLSCSPSCETAEMPPALAPAEPAGVGSREERPLGRALSQGMVSWGG